MAYVNVGVLRHLKEELGLAIDKRLLLIINKMLFKTVIPPRISLYCRVYLFICGDQIFVDFVSFLSMIIYEVLYT